MALGKVTVSLSGTNKAVGPGFTVTVMFCVSWLVPPGPLAIKVTLCVPLCAKTIYGLMAVGWLNVPVVLLQTKLVAEVEVLINCILSPSQIVVLLAENPATGTCVGSSNKAPS